MVLFAMIEAQFMSADGFDVGVDQVLARFLK